MPRLFSLRAAALVAFFGAAAFADPLPANHPLYPGGFAGMKIAGKSASDATTKVIDVAGAPGGGKVMHVEVRKKAASDYEIQFSLAVHGALKSGDIVWASVQARMIDTKDESGQGVLGLVVEQNKDPFDKLLQRRVSITHEWQQVAVPVKVSKAFADDSLHMVLRLGGAQQTLELADPQFVKFDDPGVVKIDSLPQTRLTYGGRDPSAAWRKAADERIEQIRKGPLDVQVVDAAGKPVAGAAVAVNMTQHAFPFGCVYNVSHIVGKDANTPDGQQYQKTFTDMFNVGVDEYAMKWPGWEVPATKKAALDSLQWMTDHHIKVRAHNMVWPGWSRLPTDVKNLTNDKAALNKRIDDHILDIGRTLAGKITEWDVINEPYVNHVLQDVLGDDAMAHWFKVAREADPTARLLLNETSVPTNPPKDVHYDVLFQQVQAIQKAGGPIGGVGMQAHFGSNPTSIDDLQKIYDRFATLGIPLEITEFDIDVNDEQLQADYVRDLMTITFAHPNSSGIMMWGFWQREHWRPAAALFRSDWSIKPVGQAWLDLVKKKWWTKAELKTDASGDAQTRGFFGEYDITVSLGDKSTTLHTTLQPNGQPLRVILK